MNFKKLAILTSSAALMLATTVSAFAYEENGGGDGNRGGHRGGGSDVAIVSNSATAYSNTGSNNQGNSASVLQAKIGNNGSVDVDGNNSMTTGHADADAKAVVIANVHKEDCECLGRKHKDFAKVNNSAYADADTGYNGQGNIASVEKAKVKGDVKVDGDNTMTTGNARSNAKAWVVVNVHKN